jgi:hypothetical protein
MRGINFSIYLILPAAISPRFTQLPTDMSTRSINIIFVG